MPFRMIRTATAALLACSTACVMATPVQWTAASGGNDHWYERVDSATSDGYTWGEALTNAGTRSWMGMTGYLVTVTSEGEQKFLEGQFGTAAAWIAGTDRDEEGTWKWAAGPESGHIFYIHGAASQPGYSNWGVDEPNNAFDGENYAVYGYFAESGTWNDYGGPSTPDARASYFVEYSGDPGTSVPEPATLALVGAGLLLAARRRRA